MRMFKWKFDFNGNVNYMYKAVVDGPAGPALAGPIFWPKNE